MDLGNPSVVDAAALDPTSVLHMVVVADVVVEMPLLSPQSDAFVVKSCWGVARKVVEQEDDDVAAAY